MPAKLQITITDQEEQLLNRQAMVLGYDVTKFVKFLITKEAYDQAEKKRKTDRMVRKALRDHEAGRTFKLKTLDDIDTI